MSDLTEPVDPSDIVEGGGEFNCDECGRDFDTERGLKRHRTVTHGATPSSQTKSTGKRNTKIETGITTFVAGIGGATCMFDPVVGNALLHGSQPLGLALQHLADTNPAARKALEKFLTGSAYGELGLVVGGIIMEIAVGKGWLKLNMGAMDPNAMAAMMGQQAA